MLIVKKHSPTNRVIVIISALLLLLGLYMLLLVLSPTIKRATINPSDNATTHLLGKTKDKIAGNRLYIPKIDINLPYSAGDETVMEKGAWWRAPENGNPKDGGNFVLSAHRFVMSWHPGETIKQSPFYNIDKLKLGDEITIDYNGQRYKYVINKIYAVKPDAVEIEQRTDEPQLTLYSCTLGGASDGREVIVAKPI